MKLKGGAGLLMALGLVQGCMALWPFSGSEVEVCADGTAAVPTPEQPAAPIDQVSVVFTNNSPEAADLYWDDGSYGTVVASQVLARGGETQIKTFVSHKFYWTIHGNFGPR
jgi:hypothetical protein